MAEAATGLYGSDDFITDELSEYKSPKEYASQGDTRVVRNLIFTYVVEVPSPDGVGVVRQPREAPRGTELTVEQMGLIGLSKGEEAHAFYTSDELDMMESTGSETVAPSQVSDISSLGEHELAEWITTGKDGAAWSADEVLEAVGSDKELAHRMLAAENIASDGDPRKGLTAGLTRIIEQ
jgi:hypothetical protein